MVQTNKNTKKRQRVRKLSSHKRIKFDMITDENKSQRTIKLPISIFMRPGISSSGRAYKNLKQKERSKYNDVTDFRRSYVFRAKLIYIKHPFSLVIFTDVPDHLDFLMGTDAENPRVWQSLSEAAKHVKILGNPEKNIVSSKPDYEWRRPHKASKKGEQRFYDFQNNIDISTNMKFSDLLSLNLETFSVKRRAAWENVMKKINPLKNNIIKKIKIKKTKLQRIKKITNKKNNNIQIQKYKNLNRNNKPHKINDNDREIGIQDIIQDIIQKPIRNYNFNINQILSDIII